MEFNSDTSKSPAFTGDVLFHIRLDGILKSIHMNKLSVDTINQYICGLDSFLSEIYYWIKDKDKAKQIRGSLEICKDKYNDYLYKKSRVKNPNINVYEIKQSLDKIFFNLNYHAHSNKLILRKKDNADSAFDDM